MEREKAALLLAEAVTQANVTDEVYAEATKHFDHQDFVELALTAAFYAMVGRMLDAMRIQLEPDSELDQAMDLDDGLENDSVTSSQRGAFVFFDPSNTAPRIVGYRPPLFRSNWYEYVDLAG